MIKSYSPPTVHKPQGPYNHCVLLEGNYRLLSVAGQVGADAEGNIDPTFEGQVRRAWSNFVACLESADMTVEDLVKLNYYVVEGQDISIMRRVRMEFLPPRTPSSTVLYVPRLIDDRWLFEIDGLAACAVESSSASTPASA